MRELRLAARCWTRAPHGAIARTLACRAAMAIGLCFAAGSLTGCAVTNRMDGMNAHIEEMNERMAQLNDRVDNLSKAVDKLDETNKRLGDLRDQAGLMAKQLGSIEKVARKFGGSTSVEEMPPLHQPEPVNERTTEPAEPPGKSGPALAEPLSSHEPREPQRSAPEPSPPAQPSEVPVSATEIEPTPTLATEVTEPPQIEHKVGMRVITLR